MISLAGVTTGTIQPPRICIYGVNGIGKTRLASEAPNPIFISTEKGRGMLRYKAFQRTGSNSLERSPEGEIMQSWGEVLDCINILYSEKHDFQTVVIDTLDSLEPLLFQHTSKLHGKANIEAFGYGKGFATFAPAEARVLLAGLDALRDERNMTVILLAHCDVKRHDAPDHEPYDRYRLRLNEHFSYLIRSWVDVLAFANQRVHIVRDKTGQDKTTARGVGVGERVLFTEERPAFWAKNRYSLPPELPMPEGRSWQTLQDAIVAGMSRYAVEPAQQPEAQQQSETQGA